MNNANETNGYENAPATALVATTCAACGRELVDADSVTAGMGPDCREKHGYNVACREADFEAAAACFNAIVALREGAEADNAFANRVVTDMADGAAKSAAHKIIHFLATHPEHTGAMKLCSTVDALGYTTLAMKVRTRLPEYKEERKAQKRAEKEAAKAAEKANRPAAIVTVTYGSPTHFRCKVSNATTEAFDAYLRTMRKLGAKYIPETKENELPLIAKRALMDRLTAFLPEGLKVKLTSTKGEVEVVGTQK